VSTLTESVAASCCGDSTAEADTMLMLWSNN